MQSIKVDLKQSVEPIKLASLARNTFGYSSEFLSPLHLNVLPHLSASDSMVPAKLASSAHQGDSERVEFVEVTCPSCFESFEIAAPNPDELPAVLDYDCEICCRPMEIDIREEDGSVFAEARGLGD